MILLPIVTIMKINYNNLSVYDKFGKWEEPDDALLSFEEWMDIFNMTASLSSPVVLKAGPTSLAGLVLLAVMATLVVVVAAVVKLRLMCAERVRGHNEEEMDVLGEKEGGCSIVG